MYLSEVRRIRIFLCYIVSDSLEGIEEFKREDSNIESSWKTINLSKNEVKLDYENQIYSNPKTSLNKSFQFSHGKLE